MGSVPYTDGVCPWYRHSSYVERSATFLVTNHIFCRCGRPFYFISICMINKDVSHRTPLARTKFWPSPATSMTTIGKTASRPPEQDTTCGQSKSRTLRNGLSLCRHRATNAKPTNHCSREFGIRLSDCKPRRSLPASPRREDTEEQSGRTLGGRMRRNGHLVG